MFNNNLVVAIKCKGEILREFQNNIVQLPFGSDYSIYIKNKDLISKVVVNIRVDGKDVLDGQSLLISPQESTELKGFLKGNSVKNKFRFIEKTDEISSYRGDFLEDGLIEINFRFEKYFEPLKLSTVKFDNFYGGHTGTPNAFYSYSIGMNTLYRDCHIAESGITVKGEPTNQVFKNASVGELDHVSYGMIICLKGKTHYKTKGQLINKIVTTKTKLKCTTCGRVWKSSNKYCGNCSTYLH